MDDAKKTPGQAQPQPIAIKADDSVQVGLFSNVARISHSPEAFQVDFLVIHADPPFGRLQSRVILTPGHAKRLLQALHENIERFERVHGEIRMGEPGPPSGEPKGYVQ